MNPSEPLVTSETTDNSLNSTNHNLSQPQTHSQTSALYKPLTHRHNLTPSVHVQSLFEYSIVETQFEADLSPRLRSQ